ncbi:MAG: WD40 repeat domain-containing serine/threonine protein kinase [Acidiferrobacterales bacterium]
MDIDNLNLDNLPQAGNEDALAAGYILGEYVIEAILGQGGFGITYLATDTKLGSKVAIKEFFPQSQARRDNKNRLLVNKENTGGYQWGLNQFLKEAQSLAKFKHSNIIRVLRYLELNNTAYMVMEYEEGQNLIEFTISQGNRLDERTLSKIFLPILNGLQAVHQAGLLHLDIKPDNIYLNKNQQPMLLDFGSVSKDIRHKDFSGPLALTPAYAAIEQYPNNGDQGPWSDIYSFGASMYYCVSGKKPIDSMTRYHALLKYDPDPLQPAKLLNTTGYPDFVLDCIDWALEIYPEHRPKNAAQLQEGLMGRGRPKKAGTAPGWKSKVERANESKINTATPVTDRTNNTLDTWKIIYWGTGTALVLLVLGVGVMNIMKKNTPHINYSVSQQTSRQGTDNKQSVVNNNSGKNKFTDLSIEPEQRLREKISTTKAGKRPGDSEYTPPTKQVASLVGNLANINSALFIPGKQLVVTAAANGKIFIYKIRTGSPAFQLKGHKRAVHALAIDKKGRWLASAGEEGLIRIYNLKSRRIKMTLRKHDYSVYALATSPDGKFLASGGKGQRLIIWDLNKKRVSRIINLFRDAILSLAYSPDGKMIVTGDASGRLQYFSTATGHELVNIRANPKYISALTFSRDGKWVATGGPRGELKLYNTITGKQMPVLEGGPNVIQGIQFSPNGRFVFAAGSSGYLAQWNLETGERKRFKAHKDTIRTIAISENGKQLLTAGNDKIARVWQ